MLQPCSCALVLAVLLVSLTASAQPRPASRAGPRSIALTGKAGEAPVLYLEPGSVTVVLLDGPIVRGSVEVENRAHFARVDPGEQVITLALRRYVRAHLPGGRTVPICLEVEEYSREVGVPKAPGSRPGHTLGNSTSRARAMDGRWR